MTDPALAELAGQAGLQVQWYDVDGQLLTVPDESLRAVLEALGLDAGSPAGTAGSLRRLQAERDEVPPLITADVGQFIAVPSAVPAGPARLELESGETRQVWVEDVDGQRRIGSIDQPGYHRLEVGAHRIVIAAAPPRAFTVQDAAPGRRIWGVGVQVYSLHGEHGGGFGDFGDLGRFAATAGARGADALAVSPVHALFAADPKRFAPYGPSTRRFLNGLLADPASVLDDVAPPPPAPSDAAELIDWDAAWPAKLEWIRQLFPKRRQAADFQAFRRHGGEELFRHALFETLHGHFFRTTGADGWPGWPKAYQDPASSEVAAFARARPEEVEFHQFLQWLADRSLAAAQAKARDAGMALGLIADLAVGLDEGGSHAWSRRDELLTGLEVGAPPDPLGPSGQAWGVTAFSPAALRRKGYEGFIATLRAAMAHAGGVRIDHVMGLRRLWLVPRGMGATEGAYLAYPLEDLLRLLVLESWRAKAVVIGEDLGTVPGGFRETLHGRGILGMQVLWFQRDGDAFIAPERWSSEAAALTSTHDLPTVAGWWRGRDIDWTFKLKRKSPYGSEAEALEARGREREALWRACRDAGAAEGEPPAPDDPDRAVDAAIEFAARTPSPIALIQAEDLMGLPEQPNLPATTHEHPNWRRRLPRSGLDEPEAVRRMQRLAAERPRETG